MTTLIEGKTYLFNFTKLNGEHRTMVASVQALTIGVAEKALVAELLPDGTKQARSILISSIISCHPVKKLKHHLMQANNELQSIQLVYGCVSMSDVVEQQEGAVERLEMYDKLDEITHLFDKPRKDFSFKKINGRYVVKRLDKVVGEVYSLSQVEKLIKFYKEYKK